MRAHLILRRRSSSYSGVGPKSQRAAVDLVNANSIQQCPGSVVHQSVGLHHDWRPPNGAVAKHGPATDKKPPRKGHYSDLLPCGAAASNAFIHRPRPVVVPQAYPTDFNKHRPQQPVSLTTNPSPAITVPALILPRCKASITADFLPALGPPRVANDCHHAFCQPRTDSGNRAQYSAFCICLFNGVKLLFDNLQDAIYGCHCVQLARQFTASEILISDRVKCTRLLSQSGDAPNRPTRLRVGQCNTLAIKQCSDVVPNLRAPTY